MGIKGDKESKENWFTGKGENSSVHKSKVEMGIITITMEFRPDSFQMEGSPLKILTLTDQVLAIINQVIQEHLLHRAQTDSEAKVTQSVSDD